MKSNIASESATPTISNRQKPAWWNIVLFCALILLCWSFPVFWYTHSDGQQRFLWFHENQQVAGWHHRDVPVAESAEKLLVADRLVNGEFSDEKKKNVRVFSAKRYQEKQNEIGLFVHTPDRCWTESGWRIEPVSPDLVEMNLHGVPLWFERRLFVYGEQRELVYFCGLVGGQSLPYRLDHNLSVGMKHQLQTALDKTGSTLRGSDSRLWRRVWESFLSRRRLFGPKQFIRISTPVVGDNLDEADRLLQQFLPSWLTPTDYEGELRSWQLKRS